MATIKSFTSLEQSRKLAEILPLESADMYYFLDPTPAGNIYHIVIPQIDFGIKTIEPEYDKGDIPCWSLAALLGVLPSSIKDSIGMVYSLNMNKEYIEYSNPNISSLYSAYIHTCGNDNLVDACYEMIIKLHELKLL